MKRRILIFVCLIVFSLCNVFANQTASRKTALRYLQLANDYLISSKWDEALSSATLGLAYDDTVADLWYISALTYAETDSNIKASSIINLLEKSLESEWVQYNPNSGKLFLAKYYIQTFEYEKALQLLEERTLQVNSDCLKLKAKIAYLQGDKTTARQIIERAWKIFPKDADFLLIFFSFEDSENQELEDTTFVTLKNQFLKSILDYTGFKNHYNSELMLNSVCFAEPEDQIDLLKLIKTQGINNSLYYINALKASFISENDAISQFLSFCNNQINYSQLVKISSLLKSPESKAILQDYLAKFEGTCFFDFNNDSFFELKLDYKRGRPDFAVFEQKQDGEVTWTSSFDYGIPRTLQIADTTVSYARFPFVAYLENAFGKYSFVPDVVQWVPFEIEKAECFDQNDFFILSVKPDFEPVENIDLIKNSYAARINVFERENAVARLDIADGKVFAATYTVENIPYAYGFYEDGILQNRKVDFDNDGFFETLIQYGMEQEPQKAENNKVEAENLNLSLFGSPNFVENLFIQKVLIDYDCDGLWDYALSELNDGTVEKVWYSKNNTEETVKTVETKDGELTFSSYELPNIGTLEVFFENNKPVNYTFKNETVELFYDNVNNIYWCFDFIDLEVSDIPHKLISSVTQNLENQYEFKILEEGETSYLVVRSFDFYFVVRFY